jgi:thioredoxin-like negative regulator of GroEL
VVSLNDDVASGVEGVAQAALLGQGRDLSTVTNEELEAVVAQNPDVVPMRLALARRYFEAGEFDKALDHYFKVLDREQHPEALANIGWMTYLSGLDDVAATYLEAAVERDPTYLTARWFLGNVYASLGRDDEAVVMLTIVVGSEETPDDIKDLALELIRQLQGTDG